jgi:hypothetical protein
MINLYIVISLVFSAAMIRSQDAEKIVWQNDIGKFEDDTIIYYIKKVDENSLMRHGMIKEKSHYYTEILSIDYPDETLVARHPSFISKGYFEQFEKQFNLTEQ